MSPRHQICSTPCSSTAARTASRAWRLEWISLRTATCKAGSVTRGRPGPYDCPVSDTDSVAALRGAVEDAARALRDGQPTEPSPGLERPPKPELGDYSSNAAMLLAGLLGDNPRAVVEREYYVNDAGSQIGNFADSIAARMRGEEPPEDGYAGEYVGEIAERLQAEGVDPSDRETLEKRGIEEVLKEVKATLERFGVHFDTWFSERSLYAKGEVDEALGELEKRGHTYRHEDALWLRTTDFGDDKDRVLIRSNGEATYLTPDIAYHWDKLQRGFERLIDVLGADHHGYVARVRAAIEALGGDPQRFEALTMSLVHIVEGGERVQMSKRTGDFVTLDELVDDIGADATRWFMLWRSHETTVDLDLELARSQSSENPVYYVQYAHARIASILRKAGEEGEVTAAAVSERAPLEETEKVLVKRLLEFPEEVRSAAARRAPHRVCAYSTAVAADFHAFYRDCQVVGAEGEGVESSRLALCLATKQTIAAALGLLGISAPERM